jgi:hypothetical protein
MYQKVSKGILIAALTLSVSHHVSVAQSNSNALPSLREVVGENPTADADIAMVQRFLQQIADGEVEKAASNLAVGYIGYGPGSTDSTDVEGFVRNWNSSLSVQSNRRTTFHHSNSWIIKTGRPAGRWVTIWLNYSFVQAGKQINLPVQYSAKVENGKIISDLVYYDRLHIINTLGYTLKHPEKQ